MWLIFYEPQKNVTDFFCILIHVSDLSYTCSLKRRKSLEHVTSRKTSLHIRIHIHILIHVSDLSHTLIAGNPPPRGGFFVEWFPDQEPCVRDFTTRCDGRISSWNLLHTALDQGTNQHWNPPGGGGFLRSTCSLKRRKSHKHVKRRKTFLHIHIHIHILIHVSDLSLTCFLISKNYERVKRSKWLLFKFTFSSMCLISHALSRACVSFVCILFFWFVTHVAFVHAS